MLVADGWQDFELIDSGEGQKLERWGSLILSRPDPQALWKKRQPKAWAKADAVYHRDEKAAGIGKAASLSRLPGS